MCKKSYCLLKKRKLYIICILRNLQNKSEKLNDYNKILKQKEIKKTKEDIYTLPHLHGGEKLQAKPPSCRIEWFLVVRVVRDKLFVIFDFPTMKLLGSLYSELHPCECLLSFCSRNFFFTLPSITPKQLQVCQSNIFLSKMLVTGQRNRYFSPFRTSHSCSA